MSVELVTTFIFWIAVFFVFYNYFGYGILIWLLVKVRKLFQPAGRNIAQHNKKRKNYSLPPVTLVVAAYNEESIIEDKIKNTFDIDYPQDLLHIIFITDGSTDRTPVLVGQYAHLKLMHSPVRAGKTAALNRAMREVDTPIVVFCDANTTLNKGALKNIVRHYSNPEVGGVAGEKRVMAKNKKGDLVAQEGLYWKYESTLKKLDSQYYTVVGAAGELFSIRTALWEELESNVILDDFVISLRVNLKGFRVMYEPDAYAMEQPSDTIVDEKKRKIRIAAGGFQSMAILKPALNVFKHPRLAFQLISHRYLRWAVVPFVLPVILLTNIVLVFTSDLLFYQFSLAVQLLFYAFAMAGSFSRRKGILFKLGRVCYYVLFMNLMVYPGLWRFLRNSQPASWEKANRKPMAMV